MMNRSYVVLFLLAIASAAVARSADGMLDVIITPNDGMPAVLKPGGAFEVVATSECSLRAIHGESQTPIATVWSPLPGGRVKGACTLPESVPAGLWALEADTNGKLDRNLRSLFVVASLPESYTIVHVTDTHVGSGRHARTSEDIFRDTINAVNAADAAFAVITGDVTENGEVAQFQNFVSILNTCTKATFVCSGNHDRKDLNYERFFGPDAYAFWFGKDAYLSFDTKDFVVASDLMSQNADLQLLRRAIKPARWSIGLSHRFEASQGMRSQLILFVDDPLDYLIFGHWHRENRAHEREVPWKTTPYTVTPAGINGKMRTFTISGAGIVAGEVLTVAATE